MLCDSCGTENPDASRFCMTCGRPVGTAGAGESADERPESSADAVVVGGDDRSMPPLPPPPAAPAVVDRDELASGVTPLDPVTEPVTEDATATTEAAEPADESLPAVADAEALTAAEVPLEPATRPSGGVDDDADRSPEASIELDAADDTHSAPEPEPGPDAGGVETATEADPDARSSEPVAAADPGWSALVLPVEPPDDDLDVGDAGDRDGDGGADPPASTTSPDSIDDADTPAEPVADGAAALAPSESTDAGTEPWDGLSPTPGSDPVLGGPPPPSPPPAADEWSFTGPAGSPSEAGEPGAEGRSDQPPDRQPPPHDEAAAGYVTPSAGPAPLAGPSSGDAGSLSAAVDRLAPTSRAATRAALTLLAHLVSTEQETVEGLVAGRFQGANAVAVLTTRHLMIVNEQEWQPAVERLAVDRSLQVQGWDTGPTVAMVFTSAGRTMSVEDIPDKQVAYELAARIQARTGA